METRITTEQLLQIIGEKQVMLDRANRQLADLERMMREHMEQAHPQPVADPEE